MRTHETVVSEIEPTVRAGLTAKRNGPGILRLAVHFGAIAGLAVLVITETPGWPLALVALGVLVVFLFTCLHEVTHETVFTRPLMNRIVAGLCGAILLIPPTWFRYFHLAHHRHTHDPPRDPELATPIPERGWRLILYLSGLPLWGRLIKTLVSNAFGSPSNSFVPRAALPRIRAEARWMLAAYAALAMASFAVGSAALVWLWLLPLALGQPFLRLYLMAEHGRCAHVANMLENTRTTFTNRLVRWVAWNMPYHAEHHAFPAVPFHNLPRLHGIIKDDLKVTAPGYARLHRSWWFEPQSSSELSKSA